MAVVQNKPDKQFSKFKSKEVCNKFNAGHCNYGTKCRYLHKCNKCHKFGHGQKDCWVKSKSQNSANVTGSDAWCVL